MPMIRGSGLLRDIAAIPCAGGALRQRGRFRRDALELVKRENLLNAAFCYRIVPLDEPPSNVLRAGGEVLDALRLVPETGQLTALASASARWGRHSSTEQLCYLRNDTSRSLWRSTN